MDNMQFANPEYLWAIAFVLPLMLIWYLFRNKKEIAGLNHSAGEAIAKLKPTFKLRMRHSLFLLRMIAVALLFIVMARPQSSSSSKSVSTEGIDVVMALDISTSMLAEDFKPNRIEAAKKTAQEFIKSRINDRLGLVVFAGEAYTQCPVTIDHDVIMNLLGDLKTGLIEDGTAIGVGLATAVSRLEKSDAKSKIVILLTDGSNNRGFLSPMSAAEVAQTYGIRVYTIAVGTKGEAMYPFKYRDPWTGKIKTERRPVEVEIDEELLKQIAEATDGKFFRATNNKALENIYKEIDKLEKTKIDVSFFSKYQEEYLPFAIGALIAFLLELLLRMTVYRRII